MSASVVEFSDEEAISILMDHLIDKGQMPNAAYTCTIRAERTKPWPRKGFKLIIRAEHEAGVTLSKAPSIK